MFSMKKNPNIIFIMADDMGYGDVGCYNAESKIPTPNMDRVAAEGIRFHDAHSPSAVCTPSRYGVLTGRYCWRGRLKDNVLYGYEPPLIEPDRLTVARLLQDAGYHTACIGKWHVGLGYSTKPGTHIDFDRPLPWPDADREMEEKIDFAAPLTGGPRELGFDYFFGTSGCATAQPPYGFIENEHFVETPSVYIGKPRPGRAGMTAPSWQHKDADPTFASKAVEYIEQRAQGDQPFFLYLTPSAPHEPCVPETVPEFARGQSQAGSRGDMVWLVDWMVGKVLDALDRTGLAEDTLILVTSDNGALPGDINRNCAKDATDAEERYNTYGHKSCGDWRGYKAHIWEGGHREPLVARWPGRVAPGSQSDQLICLTDLMATCAAILGTALPEDAAQDSFNMLDALSGQAAEPIRDTMIHHSCFGVFSIRKGPWKLIVETLTSGGWPPPYGAGPEPGSPGQLYNIEDDPAEQHNLWNDRPDVVAALTALLDQQKAAGRTAPR